MPVVMMAQDVLGQRDHAGDGCWTTTSMFVLGRRPYDGRVKLSALDRGKLPVRAATIRRPNRAGWHQRERRVPPREPEDAGVRKLQVLCTQLHLVMRTRIPVEWNQ